MSRRVVFDTTTVLSALLFKHGKLAWLRGEWRSKGCTPLLSSATAAELKRVLGYPKFRLSPEDQVELMGDYLPFCEIVRPEQSAGILCRDPHDQPFLDLAEAGRASMLVSGDNDLLVLNGETRFRILTPGEYLTFVSESV